MENYVYIHISDNKSFKKYFEFFNKAILFGSKHSAENSCKSALIFKVNDEINPICSFRTIL